MAAYPRICPEQKRVRLLHHVYHSSKLANKRYKDGTPRVDCLDNQTQDSLNALLVQATRTENRCKQRKCVDNYSALPGPARLEVIRILIGAGADLLAIWKPKVRRRETVSPFCAMFDRTPGFLDDIQFFIEKGALHNIPSCDLESCIGLAVGKMNISLLHLLVALGYKIPRKEPVKWEDRVRRLGCSNWKIQRVLDGVKYRNYAEKVGLLVDMNLFDNSGNVDYAMVEMPTRSVAVPLRQIPLLSYQRKEVRLKLDVIQFLCAKGCSTTLEDAFVLAIQRRNFDFLFLVPYVFFNRGIAFKFPELTMEDIEYRNKHREIEPRPIPDSMKTQAVLLAEMIRRSTKSCPASFLAMMTFISTGVIPELRDRTVPRLQDLCLLAVRTKVLIPDVKERFAENWVVLNKVPACPNLVLPAECLVPPMLKSKILLGDLVENFWTATMN